MVKSHKHKVLITGGNGYIGARLSLYLSQKGYAVVPLCYPEAPSDEVWSSLMQRVVVGDIRDETCLRQLAAEEFDTVVHLVSLDHRQSGGDPSAVAAVNITPTWSLLDIFSRAEATKFIYFSTMQVYGSIGDDHVDETYATKPQNAYALTHLLGEQFCDYYNNTSSMECRVVRLSNSYGAPVFGENNCWWLVVNDLCRGAYENGAIVLLSDGSPVRDFIHGNDVVRAVEAIISTHSPHTTYNVSSGATFSILELAQAVGRVYEQRYGKEIDIKTAPSGSSAIAGRYVMDNNRLLSLGYESEWNLDRGINDLFDYLEK